MVGADKGRTGRADAEVGFNQSTSYTFKNSQQIKQFKFFWLLKDMDYQLLTKGQREALGIGWMHSSLKPKHCRTFTMHRISCQYSYS